MDKLKPCPFCGGNVKKRKGILTGIIMFICEKCGANVCFYGAEGDPKATKAWNRRDGNGRRCNIVQDLINRQKAEIERLKGSVITNNVVEISKIRKTAKSEAIKEFAERLKPSNAKRYISYAKVERLVKEMTEEKENEKEY